MDSLNTILKASLTAAGTKARDFGSLSWPLNYTKTVTLSSGAGSSQANEVFDDYRTLAGSASENLDLAGGLTNAFGDTITAARVKSLYIENTSSAGTLTWGGAASNAWPGPLGAAGTMSVRPGGFAFFVASDATAYPVTAGTGDILKVLNDTASSLTYRIVLILALS